MAIEGQLLRRTEIRKEEGTAELINSNSNLILLQPKEVTFFYLIIPQLDGIIFKKKGNIQNLQIPNV